MAQPNGVLAIGGDLGFERLMLAYQYGIFPWYNADDPIIWWHPDPRFVLFTEDVRITKSMRPYFNQERFRLTLDQNFEAVLRACKTVKRKDQKDTWISEDIIRAYTTLHEQGYAHSVEVWEGNDLVGGMYGVSLGKIFFGESMFSKVSNASKFGLIALCHILHKKGFPFIDCQISNSHLKSMGGRYISRSAFLAYLRANMKMETLRGSWASFTDGLDYKAVVQ